MFRISENAQRLAAALHFSGVLEFEESAESIQNRMFNRGEEQTVCDLNARWDTHLSVGPYVIYSAKKKQYWSEDEGWVDSMAVANGYNAIEVPQLKAWKLCGAPDAEFCLYRKARAD